MTTWEVAGESAASVVVAPPAGVEEVDAGWLTAALAGVLAPGDRVAGVGFTRIGEGRGYLGEAYLLDLDYAGPSGADASTPGPATAVIKLAPRAPGARHNLEFTGGHRREVRFLRDLAARTRVRAPICFAGGASEEDADYVLLLEDVSARAEHDQVDGLPLKAARVALSQLAGLHASWWSHPELGDLGLFGYGSRRTVNTRRMIEQGWPALVRDLGLGEEAVAFGLAVADRTEEAYRRLEEMPGTLLHGDPRADNLMFDAGASRAPVVLLDWQNVSMGPAAVDLCYFMTQNLTVEAFAEHHRSLLAGYADELFASSGIRLDLDELLEQMAWALPPSLVAASALYAMAPPESERTKQLAWAMAERILAAATVLDVRGVWAR